MLLLAQTTDTEPKIWEAFIGGKQLGFMMREDELESVSSLQVAAQYGMTTSLQDLIDLQTGLVRSIQ